MKPASLGFHGDPEISMRSGSEFRFAPRFLPRAKMLDMGLEKPDDPVLSARSQTLVDDQGLTSHLSGLFQAHEIQHGGSQVGQAAVT